MPIVKGSKGALVSYDIEGIRDTFEHLQRIGAKIETNVDVALVQSANLIQQEVKESIVGNRSEPKSVQTGRFLNSITINKIKPKELEVGTDVDYAKYLEYGTSRQPARKHFANTVLRNQSKVKEVINQAIKEAEK